MHAGSSKCIPAPPLPPCPPLIPRRSGILSIPVESLLQLGVPDRHLDHAVQRHVGVALVANVTFSNTVTVASASGSGFGSLDAVSIRSPTSAEQDTFFGPRAKLEHPNRTIDQTLEIDMSFISADILDLTLSVDTVGLTTQLLRMNGRSLRCTQLANCLFRSQPIMCLSE